MKIQKVVVCVSLLAFTAAPGFAELTSSQLQQMYLDFLGTKNITAEVDGNGDIQFMHNVQNRARRYRIRVDPGDPVFFQIFTADLWPLESEKELEAVFLAVSRTNHKAWLAKTFVNVRSDTVIFTVQTLLTKPEDFVNVFDKLVECLDEGFELFVGEMRG